MSGTEPWLAPETQAFLQRTSIYRAAVRKRYTYYHYDDFRFVQQFIEPGHRTLIIGCEIQNILAQVHGEELHVLSLDSSDLAHPDTGNRFWHSTLESAAKKAPYDIVVLPYTLQYLTDIQSFLTALRPLCNSMTRICFLQYNFLWSPLIKLAQKLSLRSPLPDLNWLNLQDIRNLLELTGYQPIETGARCLLPLGIPGLSWILNRYMASFLEPFCFKTYCMARILEEETLASPSVTIVVPARNEAGNIVSLLDRVPVLGSSCEIIFVEGHSQDNTWDTIQLQLAHHPRRHLFTLCAYQQQGIGKADAVHVGFSKANGDLLMILDADLSVRPEDLIHFYEILYERKAEFANGSRLVYQMEKQAMQFLNLLMNKAFGLWISALIGQPVKDTLCGTKALYRKDYVRFSQVVSSANQPDPFGDYSLLFGAARLHLKICDIPVRYKERTYGSTNIRRFKDGWKLFCFCCAQWGYDR